MRRTERSPFLSSGMPPVFNPGEICRFQRFPRLRPRIGFKWRACLCKIVVRTTSVLFRAPPEEQSETKFRATSVPVRKPPMPAALLFLPPVKHSRMLGAQTSHACRVIILPPVKHSRMLRCYKPSMLAPLSSWLGKTPRAVYEPSAFPAFSSLPFSKKFFP